MSIRTYNKDHLKEHADVSLSLLVNVDSPQSSDALVFWTRHEKEPCEVNLNRFASGQNSQFKHGSGKKFKPFSGRPKLISQLTPALKEALSYASKSTVNTYMRALREWWRILDRVEHSAETTGKTMTRVDDVSLLTQIHCDFAHRSGITRQSFGTFRALVNATRMALGLNQTYWESPEDPELQKHIPPQEQRNAVRFEVRSICRNVLQRWEQLDRLSQIEAKPIDKKERILWRNVRYMRHIQKETGKVVAGHGRKACVDDTPLALENFVYRSAHVVVYAPACHATQGGKGLGVGIEQHLVALTGIGDQPECPAGTKLQMGDLNFVEHTAHDQRFVAPVELKGFAKFKIQRNKGLTKHFIRIEIIATNQSKSTAGFAGLGDKLKGIGAAVTGQQGGKGRLAYVKIARIKILPQQRFESFDGSDSTIESLAGTIEQVGDILQPILLRPLHGVVSPNPIFFR